MNDTTFALRPKTLSLRDAFSLTHAANRSLAERYLKTIREVTPVERMMKDYQGTLPGREMHGPDGYETTTPLQQWQAQPNESRNAPSEMDIVERISAGLYQNRFELLRDLSWNLFWSNRYALQHYDKRPTLQRDFPGPEETAFLPVYEPWDGTQIADIVKEGYQWLIPAWDEDTEDALFRNLISLFRHKPSFGEELTPHKPTLQEALAQPSNRVLVVKNHDPSYRTFSAEDIANVAHPVAELEKLMSQVMILANQYPWKVGNSRLCRINRIGPDDHVVLFFPKEEDALRHIFFKPFI